MSPRTGQLAEVDHQSTAINPGLLRKKYLDENLSLTEMADYFATPVGTLRKKLARAGIFKSQKMAAKNGAKTRRVRTSEGVIYSKISHEDLLKAQRAATAARLANQRARLQEVGITYGSLYRLYIEDNLSITEVGARFGLSKAKMRKLLHRYQIPKKTPAQTLLAKERGQDKFYSDPEKVKDVVAKVQTTINQRYGHKWYRKASSSQERTIVSWLKAEYPSLEVSEGDYSVIKNPSTKAALQLDIFLPDLLVAVEFNGEYWHDRSAYQRDVEAGTFLSREMLKSRLCEDKSIVLVHIWESDWVDCQEEVLNLLRGVIDLELSDRGRGYSCVESIR